MTRSAARRLLVPALAVAGMAACKDVTSLPETPTTFISPATFYKTDAEAQQAINGVYAPLMGWNGWKSPAQQSVMCDDNEMLCWNWMGGGWSGQQAGQWYMQNNSVYIGDYQIIERANEVLAYVPPSSGVSDAEKKMAQGQALFARAYAYFDLVRRFGGVPLRLTPYQPDATRGAAKRVAADTIWLQVAKDLRQSTALLPATYAQPNGQALPRAAAAWGLLAKVYLHMAGAEVKGTPLEADRMAYLDSARTAATQEMNDPSVRLESNYMSLFDVNKQNTSPEILFAVQGAATGLNGSQIPSMASPRGDCTLVGGCGQGFLSVREDFIRSFEPGDARVAHNTAIAMSWEITQSSVGGKTRALQTDSLATLRAKGLVLSDKPFKWENWTEGCGAFQQQYDSLTLTNPATGAASTTVYAIARPFYTLKYIDPSHLTADQAAANNFIILRHADVLLVYAEAENALHGPTAPAYAAINAVRARAGLGPLSGLSQSDFQQAVWTEREHELYGEFQAKFDEVREGRWLDLMNQPSNVPDFKSHGICRPRQSNQILENIPNIEMAANPLMTQNPGY